MGIEEIKKLLLEKIKKAAELKGKPITDVELIFALATPTTFSVFVDEIKPETAIDVIPAIAFFHKGKIHGFVSSALKHFAAKHTVGLQKVNVIIKCNPSGELFLMLRNAYTNVVQITAEELFNLSN